MNTTTNTQFAQIWAHSLQSLDVVDPPSGQPGYFKHHLHFGTTLDTHGSPKLSAAVVKH